MTIDLKTSGSVWQYCKDVPAVNNGTIADFRKGYLTDLFNLKKYNMSNWKWWNKGSWNKGTIRIFKQFSENSWNAFNYMWN